MAFGATSCGGDSGSRHVSIRYSGRLTQAGAVASSDTVGDSEDNAQAESLIGLYKLECVRPEGPWRDDLELATLGWVCWFNEQRLRSAIGYIPPTDYERNFYRQIRSNIDVHQQPSSGELTGH